MSEVAQAKSLRLYTTTYFSLLPEEDKVNEKIHLTLEELKEDLCVILESSLIGLLDPPKVTKLMVVSERTWNENEEAFRTVKVPVFQFPEDCNEDRVAAVKSKIREFIASQR